jgi:hypothetical protein
MQQEEVEQEHEISQVHPTDVKDNAPLSAEYVQEVEQSMISNVQEEEFDAEDVEEPEEIAQQMQSMSLHHQQAPPIVINYFMPGYYYIWPGPAQQMMYQPPPYAHQIPYETLAELPDQQEQENQLQQAQMVQHHQQQNQNQHQNHGRQRRSFASKPHHDSMWYKTEICRGFARTGRCDYGHLCQFAHGVTELRPRLFDEKFKTEYCENFHKNGHCAFGSRCKFIHDEYWQRGISGEFMLVSPAENVVRIELPKTQNRVAQLELLARRSGHQNDELPEHLKRGARALHRGGRGLREILTLPLTVDSADSKQAVQKMYSDYSEDYEDEEQFANGSVMMNVANPSVHAAHHYNHHHHHQTVVPSNDHSEFPPLPRANRVPAKTVQQPWNNTKRPSEGKSAA